MSLTRRDERNRESGCVYGEKEKRKEEEDVKQEKSFNYTSSTRGVSP